MCSGGRVVRGRAIAIQRKRAILAASVGSCRVDRGIVVSGLGGGGTLRRGRTRHGGLVLRRRRLARLREGGRIRRVWRGVTSGGMRRSILRGVVVIALVGRRPLGNCCVGVSGRIIRCGCVTRGGWRSLLGGRCRCVGRVLGRRAGMVGQRSCRCRSKLLGVIIRVGRRVHRGWLVVVLRSRIARMCRAGSRSAGQEQLFFRARRRGRGVLVALPLGRAKERRIVALVEAGSTTGLRVRYGVLNRRHMAVSALVVSERHGEGGSARARRFQSKTRNVTTTKFAGSDAGCAFLSSQLGRRVNVAEGEP